MGGGVGGAYRRGWNEGGKKIENDVMSILSIDLLLILGKTH